MMMLCIETSLSVIIRSKSSLQCLYCKLKVRLTWRDVRVRRKLVRQGWRQIRVQSASRCLGVDLDLLDDRVYVWIIPCHDTVDFWTWVSRIGSSPTRSRFFFFEQSTSHSESPRPLVWLARSLINEWASASAARSRVMIHLSWFYISPCQCPQRRDPAMRIQLSNFTNFRSV